MVKLTPKQCQIVRHALRDLISQFSSKEDYHPEDWPEEKKYQNAVRSLLRKLEEER